MSEEFEFIPEKATTELYVTLGVLSVILVLLIIANAKIDGSFGISWFIMPIAFAAALGFMFPHIRYLQRVDKYKKYLRGQPRNVLKEALTSGLDDKSKAVVQYVLSEADER